MKRWGDENLKLSRSFRIAMAGVLAFFFAARAFAESELILRQSSDETVEVLVYRDSGPVLNPFLGYFYPKCFRLTQVTAAGDTNVLVPFSGDWSKPFSSRAWVQVGLRGIVGRRFRLSELFGKEVTYTDLRLYAEVSRRGLSGRAKEFEPRRTEYWNQLKEIAETEVALRSDELTISDSMEPTPTTAEELFAESNGEWEDFCSPFRWREQSTFRPVVIKLDILSDTTFQVTFTNTIAAPVNLRDPSLDGCHSALLVMFDENRKFHGVYDLNGRFATTAPEFVTLPPNGVIGVRSRFLAKQLIGDTGSLAAPGLAVSPRVELPSSHGFLQIIATPDMVSCRTQSGKRTRQLYRSNVVKISTNEKD